MFEKFINKDNLPIIIIAVGFAVWFVFQSNYFATRLQLSELRGEVLEMKIELMKYSDQQDQKIADKLDAKYDLIIQKLDHMKK